MELQITSLWFFCTFSLQIHKMQPWISAVLANIDLSSPSSIKLILSCKRFVYSECMEDLNTAPKPGTPEILLYVFICFVVPWYWFPKRPFCVFFFFFQSYVPHYWHFSGWSKHRYPQQRSRRVKSPRDSDAYKWDSIFLRRKRLICK